MSIVTMCKITKSVRRFWSAAVRVPAQKSISAQEMFHRRLVAEDIGQKFQLSDDVLTDVTRRMSEAMKTTCNSLDSTVKCWDTQFAYTAVGSDGQVKPIASSKYLNIELSDGDHVRTRFVTVSDTNDVLLWSKAYPVPCWMKVGTGRQLFNRASTCLANFANQLGVRADGMPLVLTFGFPVRQMAMDSAVLYRSTKEYDCADLVDQDVAAELRQSLRRVHVRTGPMVILNDAIAVMLDSCADDTTTSVGLVVDNGCNCCYAERPINVCRQVGPSSPTANTIMNTEWGAFGEDGMLDFILTKYDISLNARSRQPGKQIFEKMTSGMYMAELVRDIILEMTARKALFNGHVTARMNMAYVLRADHLSQVESDAGGRAMLTDVFGVADPTDFDCELFRYACRCVTTRSACLIAAGLSGVLRRLKSNAMTNTITVAVGGSVFRTHPKYASLVQSKARTLTADDGVKFTLRMTDQNRNAIMLSCVLAKMMVNKSKSI